MTTVDAALAEILRPIVDDAVARVRTELEASMRHVRPIAITVAEASVALRTSETTVRRMIRLGTLPTLPHGDVGNRTLIPVVAIEAYAARITTDVALPAEHAPPAA